MFFMSYTQNRSIQDEETFGIMKYDRWYKRLVQRGQLNVKLKIYLVSIGVNLHIFYSKLNRLQKDSCFFNKHLFGARGEIYIHFSAIDHFSTEKRTVKK